MNRLLRASTLRVAIGGGTLALALIAALFLLPSVSRDYHQKQRAEQNAQKALREREASLASLQAQADSIERSRTILEKTLGNMTSDSVSALHWRIHARLGELAKQHAVRLQAVKYGAPSREGAKGTDLESLDVEFTAVGVYQSLKPFMLDLEKSELPFAVAGAKLEESPDGARLTATLRAFRHSGSAPAATSGEGE
ncbi:MAG TPA: hypothetical protein PKL14_00880 [Holophaga sp.]|jgi:hypothetical protein|nr:hypothetical protein [Holophaga sp.]